MKHEELRKRAIAKLRNSPEDLADLPSHDIHLLIHDLRTHQIELEMQNDELLKTQDALIQSRDRFADLYDSSPIGYLTLDKKGIILEANATSVRMLDTVKSELVNRPLSDFVIPDDQDALYHLYRLLRSTSKSQVIDIRMHNHQGTQLWIRMECNVIVDHNNAVSQIRTSLSDITDSKLVQERLAAQQNLLQLIMDTTKDMIALKDSHHVYQLVNPAFCQFAGKPQENIIGKTDFDLFDADKASIFQRDDGMVMKTGEPSIRDERIISSDGEKWLHVVKLPIIDDDEGITGVLSSIRDISTRKYYEHSIWRQANFDALTGLPNRSLFMDRCNQVIHSAHRDATRLALLFIDLDRFKWVNDTMGHEAGDKVLQETARRLIACARESDTVARLSGDEFTIILSDITDLGSVQLFAEKLLLSLAHPYELEDTEDCYISGSIGITFYPDDADNLTTLLRNADMAMYRAKERGRNTVEFYTHEMNENAHRRMNMIHELRLAVHKDEFIIHYQPIIELETGKIFGIEALLRWQHPTRGLLLPEDFLSTAEETGAIIPIGKWVLEHVTKQAKSWAKRGLKISHLAINVSARQFRNKDFVMDLNNLIIKNDLPPYALNLDLEITESLMLDHARENIDTLNDIKRLNITLSLDDFGTGYSSLQQLKNFPIDTLKIDRSFVHNILTNQKDANLTRSIINLAKDLGMHVIAEGIETAGQLDFLRAAGADYGQGYLFSEPLSSINLLRYFTSHHATDDNLITSDV